MSLQPPPFEQFAPFYAAKDLDATTYFYNKILKLPLALDQGSCRIFQITSTAFIGFCSSGTAVGTIDQPQSGIMLTLVSSHVDQWMEYLHAAEIEVEKPPTLNEKFNIYQLFVRDPNGYLVEIQTFLDPDWPSVDSGTDAL